MKVAALIAMMLALAGCVTKPIEEMGYEERKALADEILGRCVKLGLKANSPEMQQCLSAEVQAEESRRAGNRKRAQAASAALSGYGEYWQNVSQRRVSCTHTRGYGGSVQTNCY